VFSATQTTLKLFLNCKTFELSITSMYKALRITNFLGYILAKNYSKLAHHQQSYRKNKKGIVFFETQCINTSDIILNIHCINNTTTVNQPSTIQSRLLRSDSLSQNLCIIVLCYFLLVFVLNSLLTLSITLSLIYYNILLFCLISNTEFKTKRWFLLPSG